MRNTHLKNLTNFALLAVMILAWGLALAMKPTDILADLGPKIDLEKFIPKHFGDWQIDETIIPLQVDPQRLAVLNRIYSQTLARTYRNEKGERIMLSIAYGGDQRDSMQVHKPEICYPAQGFQMLDSVTRSFDTGYGVIPVKRMLAKMGSRLEPITYWITVGDTVAVDSFRWKVAQVKYGLTGKVPDGMIFRVSSLGEQSSAYPLQDDFIKILLKSLTPENRGRLIGSTTL